MPERPLPDLPPEMLLSYGGLRELEGAVAMRGTALPVRHDDQHELDVGAMFEAIPPPPVEEFDVSFDHDFDGELAETPERSFSSRAVGQRFNVLRPPQHEPFHAPPVAPPQGRNMQEVGRVGRFAILSDQNVITPQQIEEARRLTQRPSREERLEEARASLRLQATKANAKQREARAVFHESLPTAYDRLMGDDPYEDDLE